MTVVLIIVGIILVGGGSVAGFFFSQVYLLKRNFKGLKDKFHKLNNSNLDTKINKLKSISENNKDYIEVYEEMNNKYTSLINNYSIEMETVFNKIDVLFANKDYKVVKEELELLENSLRVYDNELNKIDEEIKTITSKEDEIRQVVVPLKENFRLLKANFYEHKEELSVCSKIFESKINELEKTIAKLDNKLENGYYKEASELTNELVTEVEFYEKHLEKMPKLVSFSMQVLPKRLENAINKYQKMKEEGYPLFSIKAGAIEEKIKLSLDEIRIRFEEFNYDDINESIKEAAYEIENLNESLEKEIIAKNNFIQYNEIVYAQVEEIGKKFLKSKRDTDSVKKYYLIDSNRYNELNVLESQVQILNRIKMELDAYIHSATKQPYSILSAKMGELAELGGEVEDKLNDYQNYILSLKNDSEYAYSKVNNYSVEITTLYNKLLNLNHKVLSIIYEEEYNSVCDLIQNIDKNLLNAKPIDVNLINENSNILVNKAEELLKNMKESLKMYEMAQNIIVFTNKYRSSFSTVNEVLNRAEIHFENGEFEFAIDSVSEVLQEVHPRAYEEMMKNKGYKDE